MSEICYLAKIGEINLKKGNIKDFEDRLVQNFKRSVNGTGAKITLRAGRMYVIANEEYSPRVERALSKLIGITGWAKTETAEKNIKDIIRVAVRQAEKARNEGHKTFKVASRRSDKSFPLTSYQISAEAGAAIHTAGILKVDVHNPDVVISVEVREKVFVYSADYKGRRGLPCGCSGRGLLLLSGGIDSPVAGYKMLSRGMKLDFLYFHSHPYTSPEAREKVEKLAEVLAEYGLGAYLNVVSFTKIQQKMREVVPESYYTLIMRVCMIKIANLLAHSTNAKVIVTGESLAQVASQTLENITVTNSYAEYPVFRPLIGMDKEEITAAAKEIDTYKISILPYEDCCVLFSPKHPVLRASISETDEIFRNAELEVLIKEAFEGREQKKFSGGSFKQELVKSKQ